MAGRILSPMPTKKTVLTKETKIAKSKGGETHQQAATDVVLTTNQGLPVSDNQNSLKGGGRGPTLLEDFILREKITHFDHERIPERIVHARGSGAHGYFQPYKSIHEACDQRRFPFGSKNKDASLRALLDSRRRRWLGGPAARRTRVCG